MYMYSPFIYRSGLCLIKSFKGLNAAHLVDNFNLKSESHLFAEFSYYFVAIYNEDSTVKTDG